MTTISSASAAQYSPKQHLLDKIASQVSAGKISSTDQMALDSAVDDIDSSLSSDRTSSTSSSKRLDPSQIKSRIDDLIASEVSKGTLTSDQADTLKSVLSQGGGPGGAGGPPPGPPPGQDASSGDGTASRSDSSSSASASSLLASFIQQLQASQSTASGYAANGATDPSRSMSALLLNFEA